MSSNIELNKIFLELKSKTKTVEDKEKIALNLKNFYSNF